MNWFLNWLSYQEFGYQINWSLIKKLISKITLNITFIFKIDYYLIIFLNSKTLKYVLR